MSIPIYQIGTTSGSMASLESLGIPLPKSEVVDYATYLDNGLGEQVGHGWLRCSWRFASMTLLQYSVLLGYVGTCAIQTLEQGGAYGRYTARLISPPRRPPKSDLVLDAVFEFRALVAL